MAAWDQMLADFMANPKEENASYSGNSMNYATAAALGGFDFSSGKTCPAGTTFWAASCYPEGDDAGVGSDAAWAKIHSADQSRTVMYDDGSEKPVSVCEFQTIIDAITVDMSSKDYKPSPVGVWIGGEKHSITKKEEETGNNNEYSFTSVLCMRKGEKGNVIVCTDSTVSGKACIVVASFDKPAGCTAAMAKIVALDFAKWLKESGTDQSF